MNVEETLRQVLDTIPSAIVLFDMESNRTVYLNQRAKELYGIDFEGEDVYSHLDQVRILRSDGSPLPTEELAINQTRITGRTIQNVLYQLVNAKGCRYMVSCSTVPLYDNGGHMKSIILNFDDVSDRLLLEKAISNNEKLYQSILENSYDGISMIDLATARYVYINRALRESAGLSVEQAETITLEAVHSQVHPEDREAFIRNQQDAAAGLDENGTGSRDFVFRYQRPDGSVRWFSKHSSLIRDVEGRPKAIVGITRDITEAHQAEMALAASETRFRNLLEQAPFPVIISRLRDGTLRYGNKRAQIQLGFSEGEGVGSPASRFYYSPEERDDFIGRLLKNGYVYDRELRLLDYHNRVYWALMSASLVDYDGEPAAMAMINDISERKAAEAALRESEAKYRLLAESSADVIWVLNMNTGRFTYVSPSIEQLRGYTAEEAMGQSIEESMTPESLLIIQADYFRTIQEYVKNPDTPRQYIHEIRQTCKGGGLVWVETSSRYRFNEAGDVEVVGLSRNIDERKRKEAEIRHAIEHDPLTGLLNRVALQEMLQQSEAQAEIPISVPEMALALPGTVAATLLAKSGLKASACGAAVAGIVACERAAGSSSDGAMPADRVAGRAAGSDSGGDSGRAAGRDSGSEAGRTAEACGQSQSVVIINIDGFRLVNEALGHAEGDRILTDIADRFLDCTGADGTVYRYGGDEFIIIHRSCSPAVLNTFARSLQKAVSQQLQIGQHMFFLTASVGICLGQPGEMLRQTVQNADTALYVSKQARNSVTMYQPEMDRSRTREAILEKDMRSALKRGEFLLYYQPIFDVRNGEIDQAEALLRWSHPTLGMVSPAEFIPIAARTRLILPITDWVIFEACRQMVEWDKAGTESIMISVNLSYHSFENHGTELIEIVRQALKENDVAASRLKLEITESTLMRDTEEVVRILNELKRIGCKLALDDFGTGYSSFGAMKDLPINIMKLDRSLIGNILQDEREQMIVHSMITIIHGLGLEVVLEGVETEEQLDFLRGYDCDYVQGYVFSRPLPAAAFFDYYCMMQHSEKMQARKFHRLPTAAIHFEWQPDWDSGNEEIDSQHKQLMQKANSVIQQMIQKRSWDEIEGTVAGLEKLVRDHFDREEAVLREAGFAELERHREEHRRLCDRLACLQLAYDRKEIKASAFFAFVVDDVIMGHIIDDDTRAFRELKARSGKPLPAD